MGQGNEGRVMVPWEAGKNLGRLLKDTEAAHRLGLEKQTMRNWRLLGKGPAWVKMGSAVRYWEADLDTYAYSHRIEPGTLARR